VETLNKKIEAIYGHWKNVSCTKFRCLELTQYDKIMFMDADLVVVKNIDSLFDLRTPAATFSLSCVAERRGHRMHNPYHGVKHGGLIKKHQIKKGYDSFVGISTTMVLSPCADDFSDYTYMMESMQPFGVGKCVNGADEASIAYFYDAIRNKKWTHIHQAFNFIPWKLQWLPKHGPFSTPYVNHYVSAVKPWEMKRGEWPDLDMWWAVAESLFSNNSFKQRLKTTTLADFLGIPN
jgi:lipopolysaccharide biosynthesis glycosyltransferase